MAALEQCVLAAEDIWNNRMLRKNMHWFFIFVTTVGSFAKEMQILPDSYFNNKKNIFNVYFVKYAWGWTFILLLPFILISHYYMKRDRKLVLQRLCSLVVGTTIWYLCTSLFFYIEDVTGNCYESESKEILQSEHTSRVECKKHGLVWFGYDISGHSFLLSYSALIILEETAIMSDLKKMNPKPVDWAKSFINVFYIALNVLVLIWVFMFFFTSVYFHTISHKMFGTAFGILAWYVTYQLWYQAQFSPGLPPKIQRTNLN
ncbi:fat storage-inducing transmembrane protein 2-like [Polypterus senegalus]